MTHREIFERLKTAKPGKECRALHKELKKYGDGVSFMYRYPYVFHLPAVVMSIVAIIISVVQLLK